MCPVESTSPKATENRRVERSNHKPALTGGVDTVRRCQPHAVCGATVEVAKAPGKARRYADVDTDLWKVGIKEDERQESTQGKRNT